MMTARRNPGISQDNHLMCLQNFITAEKSKRMASNPGQVLKNHQKLTGTKVATFIAPQYYCDCNCRDAATLFRHAE
jgi:hypothetical protein